MNTALNEFICEAGLARGPAEVALIEQFCLLNQMHDILFDCFGDTPEATNDAFAQVARNLEAFCLQIEQTRNQQEKASSRRLEEKKDAFKQLAEIIGEQKRRSSEANGN